MSPYDVTKQIFGIRRSQKVFNKISVIPGNSSLDTSPLKITLVFVHALIKHEHIRNHFFIPNYYRSIIG